MNHLKLDKKNVQEIYPLSPVQDGMLLHYISSSNRLYHEQVSVQVAGDIQRHIFEQAWRAVAADNDVLRSVFRWKGLSKPVVVILRDKQVTIDYAEVSAETEVEAIRQADLEKGFELDEEVFRVILIKTAADKYMLVFSNHHILLDGWSTAFLVQSFFAYYHQIIKTGVMPSPQKSGYKLILNQYLQQYEKADVNYWTAYLDAQQLPYLPVQQQKVQSIIAATHASFSLDTELVHQLELLSRKCKVSMAAIYYSAWGVLLQRYNYSEDVFFDITLSGRINTIKGIERAVGLFINTVPMRVSGTVDTTLEALLKTVNTDIINAQEKQFVKADALQPVTSSQLPVAFSSLVVFENYPLDFPAGKEQTLLKPDGIQFQEVTRYDITLVISAFADTHLDITYNETQLDNNAITALSSYYMQLLEFMATQTVASLSEFAFQPLAVGSSTGQYCVTDKYGHVLPPLFTGQLCLYGKPMTGSGQIVKLSEQGDITVKGYLRSFLLNGATVQLDELEATFSAITGIAAVVVSPDLYEANGKDLFVFYEGNDATAEKQIDLYLKEVGVSCRIIRVESIPRLQGEVNYARLNFAPAAITADTTSDTAERLKQIWSEILNVPSHAIAASANFFELGANSISIARLAGMIQQQFGVLLQLSTMVRYNTLDELAACIAAAEPVTQHFIKPAEKKQSYELTPQEAGIYLHQQLTDNPLTYNSIKTFSIQGALDTDKLAAVFQVLLNRHEAFRTYFILAEGQIRKVIAPAVEVILSVKQVSLQQLRQEIDTRFSKAFDLAIAPLCRGAVFETGKDNYVFYIDTHHIICDGFSMDILLQELLQMYRAATLTPLQVNYIDYSEDQIHFRNGAEYRRQAAYWMQTFDNGAYPFRNIFREIREGSKGNKACFVSHSFDELFTQRIQQFLIREKATLFEFFLCSFNILLSKLTGYTNIVMATPVARRNTEEERQIVGLLLNNLLLRNHVNKEESFRASLATVKNNFIVAMQHQDYPFFELVNQLKINRHYHELISIWINAPDAADTQHLSYQLDNAVMTPYLLNETYSDRDLELYLYTHTADLTLKLQYNTALFSDTTISYVLDQYLLLINEIITQPGKRIGEIVLFNNVKQQATLQQMGHQTTPTPVLKTISVKSQFEKTVTKYADRIAVQQTTGAKVTYRKLNAAANQVAHAVIGAQLAGAAVALFLEHDIDMVSGILGVLKSGNCYVPVEMSCPRSRMAFILQDADVALILTNRHNLNKVKEVLQQHGMDVQVMCLEDTTEYSAENPMVAVAANSVAYVLYTSGSTGTPKGIVQTHHGLLHHIKVYADTLRINQNDRLSLFSYYTHDASLMDIFSALLNGAALYPIDVRQINNNEYIIGYLQSQELTIYHSVPTLYRLLMGMVTAANNFDALRYVVLGGEPVLASDLQRYTTLFPASCRFINLFGQSEASIAFMNVYDHTTPSQGQVLPLGHPVSGTKVFLMNENREEVAFFETGEIVYESAGLFKEYMNRPLFTQRAFTEDHRFFFTGDLGKMLPDGSILFAGRKDFQVKINGYRIELTEVEAVISMMEGIRQCVVTPAEQAQRSLLVAYFVADEQYQPDDIREFAGKYLPEYMLPQLFVQLEAMPLTATGKADRKNMPTIPTDSVHSLRSRQPESQLEKELADIWASVLQTTPATINIDVGFYSLGGDSLKAIEVLHHIRKNYHTEISLNRFFKASDIGSIAALIGESDAIALREDTGYPEAMPAVEQLYDPFPLTKMQMAYVLGRENIYDLGGFSTQSYLEIETTLEHKRLESCLNKLIARHPALRTIITKDGQQVILRHIPEYRIEHTDLSGVPEKEQQQWLLTARAVMEQHVFDLSCWPLFDLKAYQVSEKKLLLCFSLGLITADAHSVNIFAGELLDLYKHPDKEVAPLSFTFRDYVLAQEKFKTSPLYNKSKIYWQNKLEDFPASPQIPLQEDPGTIQRPRFARKETTLAKNKWRQLKALAQQYQVTPSILCCTAYATVLAYWSNQQELALNLTLYNRLPFHKEVDQLMGSFTSLLILPMQINAAATLMENAVVAQQQFYDALEHKYYDGVEFIGDIKNTTGITTQVVMPVVFTSALYDEASADFWETYGNIRYHITRTPQVYLDHQMWLKNGELVLTWDYVDELIADEMVDTMFAQYIGLLERLLEDEQLAGLSLSQADRLLINSYNTTDAAFDITCLHQLFGAQVTPYAHKVAVKHGADTITYEALDQQSSQVAHYLISQGIGAGDYVGISGEKCIAAIVNIFGVLKAGAAYVPIEPGNPPERKAYIYGNSNCKYLLDKNTYEQQQLHLLPTVAPAVCNTPGGIAYVIYTSGTTGMPKGVVITHAAAVNTILDIHAKFHITASDKVLGISSLGFDLSVYDVFGILGLGATLVLQAEQMDVDAIKNSLIDNGITVWNSVPAILDLVVKSRDDNEPIYTLEKILLSGDWIPLNLPDEAKTFFPNAAIYSLGGATEAAIWSIYFPVSEVAVSWKSIPYGYPLANQQVYILNNQLEICPVEVKGEIYIGGAGVAEGYMNAPELTAKSFLLHPQLGKLYKTGDQGVFKREGFIEFLGRKDFQVKIRGYRIELTEIESRLLLANGVKNALVTAWGKDSRDKYLCAYLITEDGQPIPQLDEFLRDKLPEYMVPVHFIYLSQFPVTANGKIDRKSLPIPEQAANNYAAATTPLEVKLSALWSAVLGKSAEMLSVTKNFFDLGGNSLNAILLISKIRNELGLRLGLRHLFQLQTIKAVAATLGEQQQQALQRIETAPATTSYVLSSQQKRLYFLHEFDRSSLAYNMPQIVKIAGLLDVFRLQTAFQHLVQRHDSLRTAIVTLHDQPGQEIAPDIMLEISVTHATAPTIAAHIADFIRPFELNKAPLIRVGLIRITASEHILMVDTHHIISDAVSQGILIRDFIALYKGETLPALRLQYKDYAVWQEQALYQQETARQKDFWMEQFREAPPVLELPVDFPRPLVKTLKGNKLSFEFSPATTETLKQVAASQGASLFMTLLSVYSICLSKLAGTEDVVIGTPVIGRQHVDLNNMVGMFVNTLPLRNYPNGQLPFTAFLAATRTMVLGALENQLFQYESLIDELNIVRNTSRNPLFDVVFSFIDFENSVITLPDLTLEPYTSRHEVAKFDLTLSAWESNGSLHASLEYATDLFKEDTIREFIRAFEQIVLTVAAQPQIAIKDIEILSPGEKDRILYGFNNTVIPYPIKRTVIDVLEAQIQRNPHQEALVYGNRRITYKELGAQINLLAGYLQGNGYGAGDVAGIVVSRSMEMVIGIYAILKIGAAYVPIDPAYPEERMAFMLADSHAKLLLSPDSRFPFSFSECEVMYIGNPEIYNKIRPLTAAVAKSNGLAYIIYTSGSTGQPKGVKITHRQLSNILHCLDHLFPLRETDAWLLKTTGVFDVSVTELFGWCFHGGRLVILEPGKEKDPVEMLQVIGHHGITHLNFVPSLFNIFVDTLPLENVGKMDSLKYIFLAGEAVNPSSISTFRELGLKAQLENIYGPTEATVYATRYSFQDWLPGQPIPIGKPLHNIQAYILGSHNEVRGIGVKGELCIAGAGISEGYINNDALTREKFVPHPFDAGKKMYRTGDVACWLPDGNIAFLGRTDEQIKIRGYRIELEEITAKLSGYPAITGAVAAIKERDGSSCLVAYYVSETTITAAALKDYLLQWLPEYMVPVYYVSLKALPLTPSGKVDRKALPEPVVNVSANYVAPEGTTELQLVQAWSEVLGLKKAFISVTTGFFEQGGDSIKSIQLSSKIYKLGYLLTVQDIFNYPTIRGQVMALKPIQEEIPQIVTAGETVLAPIQQWFFSKQLAEQHHFNQSVMLQFPRGVSLLAVQDIFTTIIAHHDALRMVYGFENGRVTQWQKDELTFRDILEINFSREDMDTARWLDACNGLQAGISLEQGPLLKLGLFHTPEGSYLLIVIHHLVIDGVSWRILLEDIEKLYQLYEQEKPLILPLKTHAYKWWTSQLVNYRQQPAYLQATAYWAAFEHQPSNLLIPDMPSDENTAGTAVTETIWFSEEDTNALLREVNQAYHTQLLDLLLTALLMSFHKALGHASLLIDLEGHGREEVMKGIDISRTVGWFTTIYPVLLEHTDDLSLNIRRVKEALRNLPGKGFDYLLYKYSDHSGLPDLPGAQISFNYLGQFDTDITGKSYVVSSLPSGQIHGAGNQRSYIWDLLGAIAGGKLRLSLTYSTAQYKAATIKSFLAVYHACVLDILAHCRQQAISGPRLTPSDLTYPRLSIQVLDQLQCQYAIKDIYPLSAMQEGMLFHALVDEDAHHYFEQMSYRFTGTLSAVVVEESLNYLLERYDILRTVFVHEVADRNLQIVLREREAVFTSIDIREAAAANKETVLEEYRRNDRQQTFDLASDVLMRVMLLRVDEQEYEFIWSFHHILMDGWCLSILIKEFNHIYQCKLQNKPVTLLPAVPYVDYIKWLEAVDQAPARAYWEQYLAGYEVLSALPGKLETTTTTTIQADQEIRLVLPVVQTNALKALANSHQVTLNTIVQVAWGILLSKYNDCNEVLFGAVVSGRPAAITGIESMVGLFINTIPVRIRLEEKETLAELFKKVQTDSITAIPYHYTPLAEVQGLSLLGRNLLDHILVFENYLVTATVDQQLQDTTFTADEYRIFEQTNYGFTLIVVPGEKLAFKFKYDANIYEPWWIEQMSQHFFQALENIIRPETLLVEEVRILSQAEQYRLLYEFNQLPVPYPAEQSIIGLFDEQVARTPDNIALIFKETDITYRVFSEQVNKVAAGLIQRGVGTDDIIGIVTSRCIEMIVGIYAILKAGAAYVPVEPNYPQERTDTILRDSNARLLIVPHRECWNGAANIPVVRLDEVAAYEQELPEFFPLVKAKDLIYALFTSGSTGKPKGVLIEHGQVVNTLYCMDKMYPLTAADTYLMKTSCVFDVSVPELFSWFFQGGKLVILEPGKEKDMTEILATVAAYQVTHINFVPSLFNVLAATMDAIMISQLKSLKFIFQAGEAVNANAVRTFVSHLPHIQLDNLYGTTETGIYTTRYTLNAPDLRQPVPIGKPLDNTGVLILNSRGELQPIGIKGELCITGKSVGRGYINNDLLTTEKFTPHPFIPGEIMYRAGDVAYWQPDGNIAFLGRIDHQVKIRGYRIELDEIMGQLLSHETVKNAVVVAGEKNGEKYLVAYYIPQQELPENELREYLMQQLPEFMVPTFLVALEHFPVTTNGKIDRQALPEPEAAATTNFVAPADVIEHQLVQVWSDLLQVAAGKISVNADFFRLGGNSLRAMSMAAKIHKAFDVRIPVGDIFRQPFIAALAKMIKRKEEEAFLLIPAAPHQPYYPLSSAQKRLYFLYKLDKSSLAYNIPQVIRVEGSLDEQRLQRALNHTVQRHESLRTAFGIREGGPVQLINDNVTVEIEKYANSKNAVIRDFIRPFDLEQAPLIRVGLIQEAPTTHLLMLDLHHIVVDGISHRIFVKDLISFYAGNDLPDLKLTYKDYAVWQNETIHDKYREAQLAYWKNEFAELPQPWEPGTDFVRPVTRSLRGNKINFELDSSTTEGLKEIATKAQTSLFVTILSLFNVLLSKLGNQEDIVVGSVTSGRLHDDLKEMVGMFVNTLALRNYPKGDSSFMNFLGEVKSRVLAAFDHQLLQYEELIDALDLKRDPSRNPLFDVVLSYTQEERGVSELAGLHVTPVLFEHPIAKFDLLFVVQEHPDHVACIFEYATDLFTRKTVERFVRYFLQIIEAVIILPEQPLADISMMTAKENEQLLHAFDYISVPYPNDKTVLDLFEEQVLRTPNHIAVDYEGDTITYADLNERATAIGVHLNTLGVRHDEVVGLLLPRSINLIAGMLGILKSGAAYLPLDIDYPIERTNFMISDSGAKYVLTDEVKANVIPEEVVTIMLFGITLENMIFPASKVTRRPSDLCYIIYTSGSTGLPKGTMVEDRNVVRLFVNDQFLFDFNENDTWTMFHSQCFDFSVWEVFGALLFGGKLVVVPRNIARDPALYLELIKRKEVTIVNQTPSAFYNLINEERYADIHKLAVRYVIFGGEALMPGRLKPWQVLYPGSRLINMFGITETTVHVTYKEIGSYEIDNNIGSIGVPIPTLAVYILNDQLKPVPNGAIGELFVGGHGVTRGYLNRSQIDRARFITHPELPGQRLYRSGDLVRCMANGELEYIGRKDDQIQLRGFRIELREIEYRLISFPEIDSCVVTVREEEDGKFIIAYYMSQASISVITLRSYLLQCLPEYMVPTYFMLISHIPLTVNGKVNFRELPAPEFGKETDYIPPVGDLEVQLVKLWEKALKVSQIGRKDNYFGIGGDSMKAVVLVAEMNKVLNTQVRVHDLFTYQTIEELALHITSNNDKAAFLDARKSVINALQQIKKRVLSELSSAETTLLADIFPMSDIQKGMVYHGLKSPGVYHDQMLHSIEDSQFSISLLEKALDMMIELHPILRTSFRYLDTENALQFVYKEGKANIFFHDFSVYPPIKQTRLILQVLQEDKAAPFELEKPGLWRFIVFQVGKADYLLCFACHHAIIDGWSDAVFNTTLNNLYIELKSNKKSKPPMLECTYKDYIIEQLTMFQMSDYKSYWKNELAGYTRYRFSDVEKHGSRARIQEKISVKTGETLFQCSKKNNISLRSLCFSAFLYTLNIFSYEDDITIGMTTHNRPNLEDADKILGCFLNTVPFRIIIPEQITWMDFVNQVNGKLMVQKKYEAIPFTKIIESIGERSKDHKNPITDIAFNLLDFYVYDGLEYEDGIQHRSAKMQHMLQKLQKDIVVTPNTFFDFLVVKSGKSFSLNLLYHTSFVSSKNATNFIQCFKRILDIMLHDFDNIIDLSQLTDNSLPGNTPVVDINAIEQPFNFKS